jgi:hypothetical protein
LAPLRCRKSRNAAVQSGRIDIGWRAAPSLTHAERWFSRKVERAYRRPRMRDARNTVVLMHMP